MIPRWLVDIAEGLLAGAKTKEDLAAAGAGPDALAAAQTTRIDLPTFGGHHGPPPGLDESRDIAHCHPELRRRFLALQSDFMAENSRDLFPTCTYRSQKRQQALYAQGRTAPGQIVTWRDGVTKRSRHQVWPAEAIDVAVDIDPGPGKHVVWNPEAYEPLRALASRHALIWGGSWTTPDRPHLELPAGAA